MGSSRNAKDMRNQIRNVAKEILPEVFSQEGVAALVADATKNINARLDGIEKYVRDALTQMDTRNKNIQGFMMRDMVSNISNQLSNAHVTMLAWQELMQEKLSAASVTGADFNQELDQRKVQIQSRLEAEAVAKQQEAIAAASAKDSNDTLRQDTPPATTEAKE